MLPDAQALTDNADYPEKCATTSLTWRWTIMPDN